MEPKDFLGVELKVGDRVISIDHTTTSSEFRIGEVLKITPKMVLLRAIGRYGGIKEFRVSFNKVVKLSTCEGASGEVGVQNEFTG